MVHLKWSWTSGLILIQAVMDPWCSTALKLSRTPGTALFYSCFEHMALLFSEAVLDHRHCTTLKLFWTFWHSTAQTVGFMARPCYKAILGQHCPQGCPDPWHGPDPKLSQTPGGLAPKLPGTPERSRFKVIPVIMAGSNVLDPWPSTAPKMFWTPGPQQRLLFKDFLEPWLGPFNAFLNP
jgi:hypothetical protein